MIRSYVKSVINKRNLRLSRNQLIRHFVDTIASLWNVPQLYQNVLGNRVLVVGSAEPEQQEHMNRMVFELQAVGIQGR